eukprot:7981817-Pyramimonas_sp.AAC.1
MASSWTREYCAPQRVASPWQSSSSSFDATARPKMTALRNITFVCTQNLADFFLPTFARH